MKKLHRKGTVHPSPQIKTDDHLSLLPAAILTITAALSPEDREVLAYLISSSANTYNRSSGYVSSGQRRNKRGKDNNSSSNTNDHPPLFRCDCFSCYISYWVRWDSSPNRQLIHEIIDAFEDDLEKNKKPMKNGKKDKKKRGKTLVDSGGGGDGIISNSGELAPPDELGLGKDEKGAGPDSADDHCGGEAVEEKWTEKGSVRRFVSYIGERILGVWG